MKIHLNIPTPSSPPSFFFFLFLLLIIPFPSSSSSSIANWYASCTNTFNCGGITAVDYPFWGGNRPKECGHPDLQLNCNSSLTTITILKVDYDVLQIDQTNKILTIKRNDLAIGDICPDEFINTNFESSLFEYASTCINLTIRYGCPLLNISIPIQFQQLLKCTVNGIKYENNYIVPLPGAQGSGPCRESIVIPVQSSYYYEGIGLLSNLGKFIEGDFEIRWKMNTTDCGECKSSGGRCGFDLKWKRFACICMEYNQPTQRCSGINSPQLHSLTAASGAYPIIFY